MLLATVLGFFVFVFGFLNGLVAMGNNVESAVKIIQGNLPIIAHVRGVLSVGAFFLISAYDRHECRFHLDAKMRTDCVSVLVNM